MALDVELKVDGYIERAGALLAGFQEGGGELLVTSFAEPVLTQLQSLGAAPCTGWTLASSASCGTSWSRAVHTPSWSATLAWPA